MEEQKTREQQQQRGVGGRPALAPLDIDMEKRRAVSTGMEKTQPGAISTSPPSSPLSAQQLRKLSPRSRSGRKIGPHAGGSEVFVGVKPNPPASLWLRSGVRPFVSVLLALLLVALGSAVLSLGAMQAALLYASGLAALVAAALVAAHAGFHLLLQPREESNAAEENHSMLWFSSAALLSSRGCSKRWKPAWAATSAAATSAAKPEAYSRAACMAPSESTALPSATSSSASRTLTKGRTPLRSQSDAGGFGLTPTNTSLPPAWGPIFRPERDRGDSLRSCCADSGDDGGEVEIAPGCVFSMPVDTARRFSMSISRGANAGRPPTPRCCCCSRVFCSSIGRGVRVGGPRAVG
uniref:Uncharacterized protein n=1 Tax=Phaeomonas parva TaxID=124430 RepID=A0A7S1UBJ5_9STRA|mmetsp:Transcript_40387/g.126410  ORF Transcript_40387/g.126410 Transcript_40387/m.126410 type:complete len:351 (-) Transcript_40387:48-1100(-)